MNKPFNLPFDRTAYWQDHHLRKKEREAVRQAALEREAMRGRVVCDEEKLVRQGYKVHAGKHMMMYVKGPVYEGT